MNDLGNLNNLFLEDSQSVRISNHQPGSMNTDHLLQLAEINHSLSVRRNNNNLETCHSSTSWIRPMSRVRNNHLHPLIEFSPRPMIGAHDEAPQVLSMGTSGRLKRNPTHSRNLSKHSLEIIHQAEYTLNR